MIRNEQMPREELLYCVESARRLAHRHFPQLASVANPPTECEEPTHHITIHDAVVYTLYLTSSTVTYLHLSDALLQFVFNFLQRNKNYKICYPFAITLIITSDLFHTQSVQLSPHTHTHTPGSPLSVPVLPALQHAWHSVPPRCAALILLAASPWYESPLW